ncbi:hypothetical protein SAMN05421771_4121 [Granulicella pectinivorans]|jgi:hypothetical protein|uniref:Outer membrane protein beta-barrel domain-containing protein n=1 Tax=Granulicella pectinivorans TaxID=474950 RepID=A0A1I6MZY8_9BACT|nr:hypothetical protein [Granulicella pectinivorans]SFS21272.1 hypothetical protein SAMN05421771_4121 [Granulicella pectinivorans]
MSISLRRQFVRTFATSLSSSMMRLCVCSVVLAGIAHGQAEVQTKLGKQLDRLDLAVSGAGYFNTTTTGTNYLNQTVTDVPGNTLGALVQIRYIAKPWIGLEFNYGYARYTQKYTGSGGAASNTDFNFGLQANTSEYSLGYVAHPPIAIFGLKPFIGGGAGTMAYKPTTYGGQGRQEQARALYYYDVGLDDMISEHIGLRAQFRGSNSLAPDFGQNYLTILKRTWITEPAVGVFIKF